MAEFKQKSVLSKRSLRHQIESLKRLKLASEPVVKISEYKELQKVQLGEKILVVDDDEIMRNALKRIFESEGYTVTLAEDGLGLSKALEHCNMDLILLDVNLPWVDGFELCSIIKGHSQYGHIPLILISGHKDQDTVKKGISCGADHFVSKPFQIEHLLRIVECSLPRAG